MSVATAPAPRSAAAPQRTAPPRHRQALVVWLAIYPTITLVLELAGPVIGEWPLPLRTLGLTAVVVPLMVFVLLPTLQRVFRPWLLR
jgi:antibiotic biosynthesis monooxygenase (ABM) superfamily enzyme